MDPGRPTKLPTVVTNDFTTFPAGSQINFGGLCYEFGHGLYCAQRGRDHQEPPYHSRHDHPDGSIHGLAAGTRRRAGDGLNDVIGIVDREGCVVERKVSEQLSTSS